MCVGALISIPVPFITAVPITLQTLVIFIAALYLPKKQCFISIIVYILLGLIGLPVFSNRGAGLGALFGPTGGFIMAFPLTAFCTAAVFDIVKRKFNLYVAAVTAVIIGNIPLFVCGSVWFALTGNVSLSAAFTVCVLPFLPGDAVKTAAAVMAYAALERAEGLSR